MSETLVRKYEVGVVVEVIDEFSDDPEMEFAAVATAVEAAAVILRRRAEGFDDDNVVIHVLEVV